VQRRFTKRLCGFSRLSYGERLKRLNMDTLEISPLPLKRHIAYTTACCYRTSRDLLWCYKLLFGLVRVDPDDFFELRSSSTRCHPYRMFKHFCNSSVRPGYNFFAERVVNLWNNLPADRVDFGSFASFKRSVQRIHLSSLIPWSPSFHFFALYCLVNFLVFNARVCCI